MKLIVHITMLSAWRQAQAAGAYLGDTLATDGFIHCSTPTQAIGVANSWFHGVPGLVLLCIDEQKLTSPVRYEDLYASGEAFPHIYGPLPLEAVVAVVDFAPQPDGTFRLPELLAQA